MKYVPPIGAAEGEPYVDANPQSGIEGSPVPAAAIEHAMREVVEVITAAGLNPDGEDLTQLRQAIESLIAAGVPDLSALLAHLTDSANPHDVTLDQTVQAEPTLGHGVREPYAVIADAATPSIDLSARNRFVWTLGADRSFPLLTPTDQGEWHFNVYPSGHTLTLDAGWDGQVVGSPDPAASMTRLALVHDGVSVTLFVDNRRA